MNGRRWVRIATMVTWRCTATAVVALCGAGVACSAGNEPAADITSVSPASAYNDVALSLVITGGDFRPAYEFDTISGAAIVRADAFSGVLAPAASAPNPGPGPVALASISWEAAQRLEAGLPAGVAAGSYDVTITDPRGNVSTLPGGFVSLGPDTRPPIIVVESPGPETIVGAGAQVTVTLSADDGLGMLAGVTWTAWWSGGTLAQDSCAVGAEVNRAPCSFRFLAPTPAAAFEPLSVGVLAIDSKANRSETLVPLLLAPRPRLSGLSPGMGPASGNTTLVVSGNDFVAPTASSAGTQVLVDGVVIPSDFMSSSELVATTPSHDPGPGAVTVRTGGAESPPATFLFSPAPLVKGVSPKSGPAAGGNAVTIVGRHFSPQTRIMFSDPGSGTTELGQPLFVSVTRIEGIVPRGTSTATVVAYDPIGGTGVLTGAYTYEGEP